MSMNHKEHLKLCSNVKEFKKNIDTFILEYPQYKEYVKDPFFIVTWASSKDNDDLLSILDQWVQKTEADMNVPHVYNRWYMCEAKSGLCHLRQVMSQYKTRENYYDHLLMYHQYKTKHQNFIISIVSENVQKELGAEKYYKYMHKFISEASYDDMILMLKYIDYKDLKIVDDLVDLFIEKFKEHGFDKFIRYEKNKRIYELYIEKLPINIDMKLFPELHGKYDDLYETIDNFGMKLKKIIAKEESIIQQEQTNLLPTEIDSFIKIINHYIGSLVTMEKISKGE